MISMNDPSLFTRGITMLFSEIYPTVDDFIADYNKVGLINIPFKDPAFLRTIYYLLMGEYANSEIMNSSLDLFRYRFFTRIMSYGPEYERQLSIQKELIQMSDDALQVSSKTIYNTAKNPSKKPATTNTDDEDKVEILTFIDSQSTTNHQRSKLDAWQYLNSLLDHDITAAFIARFDDLFTFMPGESGLYYKPINRGGNI